MSLFTETVNRVSELEAELEVAHERIRNLEIALKAARRDKMRALEGRGYSAMSFPTANVRENLNALSAQDEEALFRSIEEAKLDDLTEAHRAPDEGQEVVRAKASPLTKLCALVGLRR